jgi:hypothetical protein
MRYVPTLALCLLATCLPAGAATYVVDGSAAKAADTNAGSADAPLKTIGAAAAKAQPGDTISIAPGIYRERVTPPRGGSEGKPVTYEAQQAGKVFVRASDVFDGAWEAIDAGRGIYKGTFKAGFMGDFNPFKSFTGGSKTITEGQVFVDGGPFTERDCGTTPDKPGQWAAIAGGSGLVVNFGPGGKPQGKLVEVSTRNVCFAPKLRGLGYITIRGIIFEHAANRNPRGFYVRGGSQIGMVSCRSGHHWVIEQCTIRYAKTTGIDVGIQGRDLDDPPDHERRPIDEVGYHLIRNNIISDNGVAGVCGLTHKNVKVIGNIFERNSYLGIGGNESGGVKFHLSQGAWIEGNLFRDNDCSAIWLDNNNQGSRVTRNVIINSEGMGIFIEMANHPIIVDNNVVAHTRYSGYKPDPKGDGLYTHDAGGVTFAHNLSYQNVQFGAIMRIVTKRIPMHSGQQYLNNMLLDNPAGELSMPYPGPKAKDNTSDGNILAPGKFPGKQDIWPYRFVTTTLGGAKMGDIQTAFAKACPGDDFKPAANREASRGQSWVLLTGPQWIKLTGCDANSRTAKLGPSQLDGAKLILELDIDDAPQKVATRHVEKVDRDLFGKPIPKDKPLPGPFQDLKAGKNRLVLWPLPDIGPNPPAADAKGGGERTSVSGDVLN